MEEKKMEETEGDRKEKEDYWELCMSTTSETSSVYDANIVEVEEEDE